MREERRLGLHTLRRILRLSAHLLSTLLPNPRHCCDSLKPQQLPGTTMIPQRLRRQVLALAYMPACRRLGAPNWRRMNEAIGNLPLMHSVAEKSSLNVTKRLELFQKLEKFPGPIGAGRSQHTGDWKVKSGKAFRKASKRFILISTDRQAYFQLRALV